MLAVIVAASYIGVLLVIGAVKSRRVHGQETFSLAGRSLGVFVLSGTLIATWTGTGTIFGMAEKAYSDGWPVYALSLGPTLGLAVLLLLCTRIRAKGRYTLQDVLEERFGPAARVIGSLTLVSAYLVIVSYQLRAAGAVVGRLATEAGIGDPDPFTMVGIVAVLIAVYTAMAGMMSVAFTDLLNGLLMFGGLLVAIPFISDASPAGVLPATAGELASPQGTFYYLSYLLPTLLLVMGDANMHSRFLSAKSDRIARVSVAVMIPGILLIEGAVVLLANAGREMLPGLENPGHVILELAMTSLPLVVGAVLVAAVLAVIVSTADSFLLSSSTSLVRDVYQRFVRKEATERQLLSMARVMVFVLTAAALVLSTFSDAFFGVAFLAYTIYGVGITPALIAALFWKRATPAGGVSGMLLGTATVIVWTVYDLGPAAAEWLGQSPDTPIDAVIPGILVALLVLFGVSLATAGTERCSR